MDRLIDLHTHSTASDGSLSPSELVKLAKASGLAAVALTDHDTIQGIDEALAEGEAIGIEVISGIEISVDYRPEMHILGYFFNDTYKNIEPVLERLKKNRAERNPKIARRLNELGFEITMEEVVREAKGTIVARPHFAKVLMNKGYVQSISEAFDRLLGSGKPAYFKKDKLDPAQGIKEITTAGGIPVLAHPVHLNLPLRELDELLGELKQAGLAGTEAYYVDNSPEDTGNLLRLCIKHDLIPTGGSDYHGSFKPDIEIGRGFGNLKVPYESLERLKKV